MIRLMTLRQEGGGGGGSGNNRREAQSRRPRGFAAMSPELQREIARKGGQTVSQDRDHMASIGRRGGEASRGGRGSDEDTRS
jgi:general stress protein YciG